MRTRTALLAILPALLATAGFAVLFLLPLSGQLAYQDCVSRAIAAKAEGCDLIPLRAIVASCRAATGQE